MHQIPLNNRIEVKVKARAPLVLMVIVTRRLIKIPNIIKNTRPMTTPPIMIKGKKEYHQGISGMISIGFVNT